MEDIIISRFLKRHSEAKCTSLLTSAATNQRVVHGKLRSDFQVVRGDIAAVKVGVACIGRVDDQMSQGKCN